VVTAKEKLRDIFASGLIGVGGIAFSSEKAGEAKRDTHGIEASNRMAGPTPPIYSAEASLYVLKAGVELVKRGIAADFPLPEHDGFHAAQVRPGRCGSHRVLRRH
jgi:phosphonoacetate hydrolase